MQWKWWFDLVWPVFVAAPGFVAFWWAWRDRRSRLMAEQPYGEWNFSPEPDEDGWYASEISIKNRWDEPLYGRHIRIRGLRGARVAVIQKLPSGSWVPDLDGASSRLPVDWTFWSSSQTAERPSSGATLLYVKPPSRTSSGYAQSGTGAISKDERMSRLTLEVTLISASNRRTRLIVRHKWSIRPVTKARKVISTSSAGS